MGSPKTEKGRDNDEVQHRVTLSRGFWIMQTPVTQALWEREMSANPSRFKGPQLPVEQVSWCDGLVFANALSEKEGLTPAYQLPARFKPGMDAATSKKMGEKVEWVKEADGYRLPTEAEWEYAARAGEATLYAGGDDLDAVGWYCGNSSGKTHPVGQKAANRWEIHDMSGNVFEWCWDRSGTYKTGENIDPDGVPCGVPRVFRGGSWGDWPRSARSAFRNGDWPGGRAGFVGLRLVRFAPPSEG